MDTNPWDEAIGLEPTVIKSCAPTPQTWQFFDLTAVFSSFSCHILAWTRSLSCEDQVPCKLLCELLKSPTSSIMICSVCWRLTYHWQGSFTVVHHFVSDGENSAWDQVPVFVRYWHIQSLRSSYWFRTLHFSPTTWHDNFYNYTPFVSGWENSSRDQVPTFVRIIKTPRI